MSRTKGPANHITIFVRILVCTPIAALITFLLSAGYHIPTPGLYVAMKLVPDPGPKAEWLAPLIPRLVVAGFVNALCCYLIVVGLVAVAARLRGRTGPTAPGGRI
jgi:hypothetical protein